MGFVPQWGVLLAGDAVETPLPFLNPGSELEGWAGQLEEWARRQEGWAGGGGRAAPFALPLVIPSHGKLGGSELLRGNASYLRALSRGRQPELPPDLPPFYLRTHAANREIARGR